MRPAQNQKAAKTAMLTIEVNIAAQGGTPA
jgi:hypothetical protein